MSEGANANSLNTNTNTSDAPFEWLTNFRSLRHLVLPSRIVLGSSPSEPINNDCTDASASSHASQRPHVQLNALHVGCGTSTVGESLLSLRERVGNDLLRYSRVVNVDNDENALDSMRRRWERRRPRHIVLDDGNWNRIDEIGTMEWKCLDFKNEESCRSALDGIYRQLSQNNDTTITDHPGGCFDLVLDKSTLDCLLCAETNIVAQFLHEVYRALRMPNSAENDTSVTDAGELTTDSALPSSWGGVYVLVTFHPAEFVERLLTQLPGADWHVEYEVIKREVEDVNEDRDWAIDEVTYHSMNNSSTIDPEPEKDAVSPSSSAWSSGTFHPDENYRKTVTVFTCCRCLTQTPNDAASPLPTYILDREKVREHVERICDDWYQTTNPMVTSEREEQLRVAFSEAAAGKMNIKSGPAEDREPVTNDAVLDLRQCYEVLFTDAEKEHLTYEYFLEDWDVYCERVNRHGAIHSREGMTVTTALDFLKEMQ